MEITDIQKQHYLGNIKIKKNYVVYTKANMNQDLSGYDRNLYVYDLNTKQNKQLTASSKDGSFDFIDETTILFESNRQPSTGTSFYTISLTGGEASFVMNIPAKVSKLKKLDENTYIFLAINDTSYEDYLLSDNKQAIDALKQEEKDYEVIDELPYVANGRGFINKLRKSLYVLKDGKYIKLSGNHVDVADYFIQDDQVYFFGNEFKVMRDSFSSLYQASLVDYSTTTLLDHRLSIQYIAALANELMIVGHDGKKYEFNKNPEVFKYVDGDIESIYDFDTSFASKISADVRLVGGSSFKVYQDQIFTTITTYSHSDIQAFSLDEPLQPITDFKGSVDCFDIDESIVFVGLKGEYLQEIYQYHFDTKEIERLTDFSHDYLELGCSLPVSIPYQKNGIDYEGFVIYPKDYDPTKTYPAILEIHGGPKVAYGDVYTFEFQLMASKGYFVFYTNPRGSDGRGNEFADVYGKMGVIDYQDLMDFTDLVLERIPQIDPTRVGVTGGSYGGYMTNWIIGHTNRFAAAVSQRSISNYVSKSLTTDIGYYHNMKQTMATPWEGVEKMWFHSPLKYANQATTPTLFIQSDEDFRCWQGDAYQMYQALILNGCRARMCIFHGENHELSRSGKPKHRIRRLTEMMNWFDEHIGG